MNEKKQQKKVTEKTKKKIKKIKVLSRLRDKNVITRNETRNA